MIQDKAGNYWFLMKDGICRYDASASAGKNYTEITAKEGLCEVNFDTTLPYPFQIRKHLLCLQQKTGLIAVFKVCIRIRQAICGGVLELGSIALMVNGFTRLNRKGRGSINEHRLKISLQ